MPTVVRVQYSLPDAQFLNELLRDDLILRYVKDDYSRSEHCLEFYDTEDWAISSGGFSLAVARSQELPTVQLQQGLRIENTFPGLYHGRRWIAPFEGEDSMISSLLDRGAPEQIRDLAASGPLYRCFHTLSHRLSTTLYLPDRTRVDMAFDNGELVVEDKRSSVYYLYFELLFGEEGLLLNYCEQVSERFSLAPVMVSRQQQALRLLRSR